jgi:hypothetical protein
MTGNNKYIQLDILFIWIFIRMFKRIMTNILIFFLITVIGTCGKTSLTCVAMDSSLLSRAEFAWVTVVCGWLEVILMPARSLLSRAASQQNEATSKSRGLF